MAWQLEVATGRPPVFGAKEDVRALTGGSLRVSRSVPPKVDAERQAEVNRREAEPCDDGVKREGRGGADDGGREIEALFETVTPTRSCLLLTELC